jgi:chemotaxis signal transduction protein
MATLLRSRRFADRATEPTLQYITFQLRQYSFALPIQNLKRVSLVKDEQNLTANLGTLDQEQEEVRFIDVDHRIFASTDSAVCTAEDLTNLKQQSCVILFSDAAGQIIGLTIDTQPKMQRIAQSQILPLPLDLDYSIDLQSVCVSMIQTDGKNPILLLDLDKLCAL